MDRDRLDVRTIALRNSVSTKTVHRWIGRGLPFTQGFPRAKILIKPEDVEAFLQRRCKIQVDLDEMVKEVAGQLEAGQVGTRRAKEKEKHKSKKVLAGGH